MGLLAHDQWPVTGDRDRSDLALGHLLVLGRLRRLDRVGQRLADGDRGVTAAVDAAPVGGSAHLRLHLVEREVEGTHLVLGRGLGPDDRALGEGRQLDLRRPIVLARVLLELHLHLDPDDPVIMLLQTGEFLRDMFAEPIRHLAVPSRDHNLHVNLLSLRSAAPLGGPGQQLPGQGGMEPAWPTWSSTPQSPAEAVATSPSLLAFSRPSTHLVSGTRQDLLLSRTVIVLRDPRW